MNRVLRDSVHLVCNRVHSGSGKTDSELAAQARERAQRDGRAFPESETDDNQTQ